jgi:hypothetical protein
MIKVVKKADFPTASFEVTVSGQVETQHLYSD